MEEKHVNAGVLRIGYREFGPADGWSCVMLHGFPYDVEAYTKVAPVLAEAGARVIVPYMRGYGPTKFLCNDTPRSGEQAAFGADLLALLDALDIKHAVLGGYDWGGRAACVVTALWPDRVTALVTGNSYNIQNIAKSLQPAAPAAEAAYWYQYYFHSERGRWGLTKDRRGIARLLWQMWSPNWDFDDATFDRSADSFDNPDFVDIVIHSYRHRYGLVPGDPAVAVIETRLAAQPPITVPTIAIDGTGDGVSGSTEHHAHRFVGRYAYRTFAKAGHNLPQERPAEWAKAVIDARKLADG